MTVEEAKELFKAVPTIREKMETLARVGLDYIHVGQQATTLSGGEAQRVKLSKELSKRATGRTLYILDEPTTGLHFHDVAKLLEVLHELVEQGNTVVVIEHNLEVIKTADWVIDIGPRRRRRRRRDRRPRDAGGRLQGGGELHGAVPARGAGAAAGEGRGKGGAGGGGNSAAARHASRCRPSSGGGGKSPAGARAVEAERAGTREDEEQEDEAVEDRPRIAVVEHREEVARRMEHPVGDRHLARGESWRPGASTSRGAPRVRRRSR